MRLAETAKAVKLALGVNNVQYPAEGGKKVSLGDVAIWNQYGTDLIPPRPFATMAMEQTVEKNKTLFEAYIKNSQRTHGNPEAQKKLMQKLLGEIGRQAAKRAKEIILQGETVHNAPSTVAKKGFDHPLFETGLLSKNIAYQIVEEE